MDGCGLEHCERALSGYYDLKSMVVGGEASLVDDTVCEDNERRDQYIYYPLFWAGEDSVLLSPLVTPNPPPRPDKSC